MKFACSYILSFLILVLSITAHGQIHALKPGFDKQECLELLKLSAHHADSSFYSKLPKPENFKLNYRCQPMGLQFC